MYPDLRYTVELQQALEKLIGDLRSRRQEVLDAAAASGELEGETERREGEPGNVPPAREVAAKLDRHVQRIDQIRGWLNEDEELARLVDSTIGGQVKAAERRQARRNFASNVAFLLLGWLLSLVGTPANLWALLQPLLHR